MRQFISLPALFLAACTTQPAEEPHLAFHPKASTLWVAESPGWTEEAEAVYAEATDYITAIAAERPAKSWAVVLDIDETVLNNVQYQIERERIGENYSPDSWHAWTQEKRATLVPGAVGFLDAVNQSGGFVAFVTNRSDSEQLATEENLSDLGIERNEDFRVLITRARPDGPGSKQDRYELVPAILAVQGYPDVEVIAYVGDNVHDKPDAGDGWAFFCIDQGAMYGEPCAAIPGPGK